MTFTKYSPKRKRSTKPIISVSLQGFQLNRKSQELFKGKDFVELYYDTKLYILYLSIITLSSIFYIFLFF